MSLITGLLGMSLLAIGFGLAAIGQIRRQRERGLGMAITGMVAGATWLVASIVIAATLVPGMPGNSPDSEDSTGSGFQLFPKPGQCFDIAKDDTYPVRACGEPHDAEMVVGFVLPKQNWPGEKELERLSMVGCEQRILGRYGTRIPVENGEPFYLYPRQVAWRLGDRKILCGISAIEGDRFNGPIGTGGPQVRALEELRPGDCFATPRPQALATKLIRCDARHDAQLTHRFVLPVGPYPGDPAMEEKAESGCGIRWEKLFGRHPSPVRIEQWYLHPSRESWAIGDRLVLCYVTGAANRDLTRSVVPR